MAEITNNPKVVQLGSRNVMPNVIDSKIDTAELIKIQLQKYDDKIQNLQDQISRDNDRVSAFAEFKTLLNDFSATLEKLRYTPGLNKKINVFSKRVITLNSDQGHIADSFINVNADTQSNFGGFSLAVNAIAKSHARQSATFSSKIDDIVNDTPNATANNFNSGTFQLNGIDITVTNTDSLSSIASKINASSAQSNVSATIISPQSGSFRLMLSSTKTGIANIFTITDNNSVLNNLIPLTAPSKNSEFFIRDAVDAELVYNNDITFTRPTNEISDFIDGLVIVAKRPTLNGDSIWVNIGRDLEAISQTMVDFVNGYNNIMEFQAKHNKRDDRGAYDSDAKLARDTTLKMTTSRLISILGRQIDDSAYKILRNIGIESRLQQQIRSGNDLDGSSVHTLEIDASVMAKALLDDYDGFRKIFEYDFVSSKQHLLPTDQRGDKLNVSHLHIDVNINREAFDIARVSYTDPKTNQSVTINMDFELLNTDNNQGKLIGKSGTILEGWEFFHMCNVGVNSCDVDISQGLADLASNFLQQVSYYKAIDTRIDALNSEKKRLEDNIKAQETKKEKEHEQLLQKYARQNAQRHKAELEELRIKIQMEVNNRKY